MHRSRPSPCTARLLTGGLLPHLRPNHHLELVLELNADVGCDVAGQLVAGALEAVDHLLELAQQGVPGLVVLLLHVGLQLLDICNNTTNSSNPFTQKDTNKTMVSLIISR